jgi:hypothetical protein
LTAIGKQRAARTVREYMGRLKLEAVAPFAIVGVTGAMHGTQRLAA